MSTAKSVKKETGSLTVWEYETSSNQLSIARAILQGRFPEKGRFMNTVCEEIYYVVRGTGTLYIEDSMISLIKGDVYLIEPNKKYYVEGNNLELILPTAPKWTHEQSKIVD